MNKDEFLKHKTRNDIVQAFLGKLETLSVKDVDIVAALNHFVETGNESYFKEFCDFHFIKTMDEKLQEIDKMNKLKEKIDEAKKVTDKYKKDYEKYLDDYKKWFAELFNSLHKECSETGKLKLFEIAKFAERIRKQNGHDRLVWVYVDGKLKPVENIFFSANFNSVIMELRGEEVLAPKKPERPSYLMNMNQVLDFFDF